MIIKDITNNLVGYGIQSVLFNLGESKESRQLFQLYLLLLYGQVLLRHKRNRYVSTNVIYS